MNNLLIKICERCSGITKSELTADVSNIDVLTGCTGQCGKHIGKVFGLVNFKLLVFDNKEQFLNDLKEKSEHTEKARSKNAN